jgi:hypothetical protein
MNPISCCDHGFPCWFPALTFGGWQWDRPRSRKKRVITVFKKRVITVFQETGYHSVQETGYHSVRETGYHSVRGKLTPQRKQGENEEASG